MAYTAVTPARIEATGQSKVFSQRVSITDGTANTFDTRLTEVSGISITQADGSSFTITDATAPTITFTSASGGFPVEAWVTFRGK